MNQAVVGFARCGCAVAVLVIGYDTRKGDVAAVTEMLLSGYSIKGMPVEEMRALPDLLKCPHLVEQVGRREATALAAMLVDELLAARGTTP